MKTWNIEIEKVTGARNAHGSIRAQIEVLVEPATALDDGRMTSTLTLTEANARVLMLLLRAQLADIDSRKAKSRR